MSTAADILGAPPAARSLPTDDYLVDGWLVQPSLNRVAKHATAIRVRPQLIDVLTCLAQRPGAVVSKDELLATVWSDRFVAESGIARCVAELRQLLADDARQPRIIETIPKRGYRLIAEVGPVRVPNPGGNGHAAAEPQPSPETVRVAAEAGASHTDGFMTGARAALLVSAVAGLVRRIVG